MTGISTAMIICSLDPTSVCCSWVSSVIKMQINSWLNFSTCTLKIFRQNVYTKHLSTPQRTLRSYQSERILRDIGRHEVFKFIGAVASNYFRIFGRYFNFANKNTNNLHFPLLELSECIPLSSALQFRRRREQCFCQRNQSADYEEKADRKTNSDHCDTKHRWLDCRWSNLYSWFARQTESITFETSSNLHLINHHLYQFIDVINPEIESR